MKSWFTIFLMTLLPCMAWAAADTLRITLRQADSIFLKNNYSLLAASMGVQAQEAQVIQARIYPNPIITAEVNVYDPDNNKYFHTGQTGQKFFQIEQLILLGGKRKAEIDLAKTNATIASLEFQDLVRQLKYELHSSLYSLTQQAFLIEKYNAQLAILDGILTTYNTQVKKGNLPLKDFVRLKGVYLNLNNDRGEVLKYYLDQMARVQTILSTSEVIIPIISETELDGVIKTFTTDELQFTALDNRADYLIASQNTTAAEQYYSLQKKLAVPDVNVFANYDQLSGAFNNQISSGISIPLPLWNRNRGNIKTAQFQIKQRAYDKESLKNEILVTVQNQFALYNHTVGEYTKARELYNIDFEETLQGMSSNFLKNNVSVLEFVDFFESYNNSMAEIARIKIQLAVSAEQLNLTIGKDLF
jgi:outer membrane protein, heavy metal efflux system